MWQPMSFAGRDLSSRGRSRHPAMRVGVSSERQAPLHLRGPAGTEQSPRGRRSSPESPTGTSKGGRGRPVLGIARQILLCFLHTPRLPWEVVRLELGEAKEIRMQ